MLEISIIIPIRNAENFISECIQSIIAQTNPPSFEVCVLNDSSTDKSPEIFRSFIKIFEDASIDYVFINNNDLPFGGKARNICVANSKGRYLCFLDADDIMKPKRLESLFNYYNQQRFCQDDLILLGSKFERVPQNSTTRFTNWANNLPLNKLNIQIYTSNGPTVLMPTWFMSRKTFDRCGGFIEDGRGCPEDLLFFYNFLSLGGHVHRVDEFLLIYRYNLSGTTFTIDEQTIFDIRLNMLIKNRLNTWDQFTIWNAGKLGKKFYRSLPDEQKRKVSAFCDIDPKKINLGYYTYFEFKECSFSLINFFNLV